MSTTQDGSESVDQFLARIASVREGRDQATEERTRRMEEDFLKNRKERQARRLERARSLSPSKTGPLATYSVSESPVATKDSVLNPPVDFSPQSSTLSRSNAVSTRTSPKLGPKQFDVSPIPAFQNTPPPSNNSGGVSRSGTLSWQQRPPRDGLGTRPRPLSTIETVKPIHNAKDQALEETPEPTRQQIAASLGMKDPTWFRQTQERGAGSAAFRKTQVEDTIPIEPTLKSQALPGISKPGPRSERSTPVRDTVAGSPRPETRLSPPPSDRTQRERSPTPRSLPDPPIAEPAPIQSTRDEPSADTIASNVARSGGVILAGRSPSPTKGLGGFVESAMMKRSDSVNKRWSVQASAGLKRGDSVAGMRPLSGVRSMHASTLSKGSTNRDGSPSSPANTSRPESREGAQGVKSQSATPDRKVVNLTTSAELPQQNVAVNDQGRPNTPPDNELSRSPSKTFDSRRWSPTKSSWLESALLSKPDPPKPQPAEEKIPAWKATMQRNKASRDISPDKHNTMGEDSREARPQENKQPPPRPATVAKSETRSEQHPATAQKAKTESTETRDVNSDVASSIKKDDLRSVDVGNDNLASPSEAPVDRPAKAENLVEKPLTTELLEKKPAPALKPKPQTPPKTDFRSTLKSRSATTNKDGDTEPEFKSVFGKLKPTRTQNYVAPDVLKTNILSGKAALNLTGGPQKTERVDEFKQSILKKKEAMKESAVQKKENPTPEPQSSRPEPALPEALARRRTLHKASPSVTKLQSSLGASSNIVHEKQTPPIPSKPATVVSPLPATVTEQPTTLAASSTTTEKLQERTVAASFVTQQPPKKQTSIDDAPRQVPTLEGSETQSELPANSKLASRLNPSLAAFLSRGSTPKPPGNATSPERRNDATSNVEIKKSSTNETESAGELTHMTKGRAKGPKRRAPKPQPTKDDSPPQAQIAKPIEKVVPKMDGKPTVTPLTPTSALKETFAAFPKPSPSANKSSAPILTSAKDEMRSEDKQLLKAELEPKAKPVVVSKSPQLRKVSSTLSSQQTDAAAPKMLDNTKFEIATDTDTAASSASPAKSDDVPKGSKPLSGASPLTPSKSRINAPKPNQESARLPPKPQSVKPITSPEVTLKPSQAKPILATSKLSPPSDLPAKPHTAAKPSIPVKPQQPNTVDKSIAPILSAYFPKPLERQQRADFDAPELLSRTKKSSEKSKTTSCNIWEITGDGKKSAMPPQQEHILFEDSMYLIAHVCTNSTGGKQSEVYLWCGDGVGDAALEDAQLFCRKDAREHNTKLEVVKQGKEPAGLFQALGGILITRRNKSTSLYILHGRRHAGHIAFDEVDFSAQNLCSGFPYLISAKFGKLYLWKGKGSGADEVGCARLIGMDLGLTGEIEEVDEGKEPGSFWEAFPDRNRSKIWSGDWQQRAEHDCYPSTLYHIDLDRGKSAGGFWGLRAASPPKPSNKASIEPITTFCDRDIEPTNVYVLDAYRSIYVILHPQATSKLSEIVTAMHFAQEIAMLSPSIQGRSLMPSCFVAFGDPPADVKMCFRKWSPHRLAVSNQPSACIELEQVMEALKL